jgi:hypothetical protein
MATVPLEGLEEAEAAYNRIKPELDALSEDELTPINLDLVSATSIALGVAERILAHRERIAKLPEFDIRHVDSLVDYAKGTWYAYVTNLPAADPRDLTEYLNEVAALRSKMLMWAAPLAGAGKFDEAAIARIKEGSGHKDSASDVVALVGLYRSRWEEVKNMCGVTEEELIRAAQIAPAVFSLLSKREFQTNVVTDGSLRVRRAWTLLDRAYGNCRRALAYLRYEEGDADTLAPSLRRNAGPGTRPTPAEPPTPTPPLPTTVSVEGPTVPLNGGGQGGIGSGDSPFMGKS